MQTTTTIQPTITPTQTNEKASAAKRYIKITDHNGKTRKVYDPDNRLGRKRLCLKTFVVYFQVFLDGEVIGHLEHVSRGVYRCICGRFKLGVRFNVTEAIDLVMITHERNS
jgi:hypothetical protein